jgi:truncated hemoglobin YjbI
MSQDTLYQRIGGEVAITAAVDHFYERILADPSLSISFRALAWDFEGASVRISLSGSRWPETI